MLSKIKQNFSYLFISELAARALTLIFTIFLARLYGPEQFGIYGLALSMGGLFDIMFNMGLATVFMQRVAADTRTMRKQLAIFLPLRLLLSLGLMMAFALFAFTLQKDSITFSALLVAGVYFAFSSISMFLWACFDARQRMGYTALSKLLLYIVAFGAGMNFVLNNAPMYEVMSAYIYGALISLGATIWFIHRRFTPIHFTWDPAEWKKIISAGWPIALSGTFVFVYTSLDTILISISKGEYFVGQYQMAYKIIGTIFILATLINQAYFPSLIEKAGKSVERLRQVFNANFESVFFWSVPITVGGLMLADRIILFIFGVEYMPGATAFKILIFNTVIFFASSALINLLYAYKKQRSVMKVFFFGALGNIILNLLVIPVYGIEGAAATTIVAELIVLAGISLEARKKIDIHFLPAIVRPTIAALVMAVALSLVYLEGLILTVLLGALVYFGTYFSIIHVQKLRTNENSASPPTFPHNVP